MKLRNTVLAIAGLLSLSLVPAHAGTVYDWTLSGTLSGSGTITLGALVPPPTVGGFYVDGITGEIDASNITGLTDYFGSDNIIYPSNTTVVDDFGFAVLLANGISININPGGPYNVQISDPGATIENESFDLTPVSATPLPTTWVMMLMGLGLLGFVTYRRGKEASAVFAAM